MLHIYTVTVFLQRSALILYQFEACLRMIHHANHICNSSYYWRHSHYYPTLSASETHLG